MPDLKKSLKNALVIGSSGGIAQALVSMLLDDQSFDHIYTVSRSSEGISNTRIKYYQVNSVLEDEVEHVGKQLQEAAPFSLIICCIGTLHGGENDKEFRPEKRLESLKSDAMLRYFQVNTLAPMHWLKQVPQLVSKSRPSKIVFFTARVASIEDNHLGGWYGYRASKTALNMLIKTAQIELSRRVPKAVLVSYHPGTVDTDLSQPFQKNVPKGKLFTPEYTAMQLLKILPNLKVDNAPHYIDWQGQSIPW
jgi:NAD(P)-dependent dehydrogenase (short-subunit alcohol dehydrogenase family)